jgi:hypothetical protein
MATQSRTNNPDVTAHVGRGHALPLPIFRTDSNENARMPLLPNRGCSARPQACRVATRGDAKVPPPASMVSPPRRNTGAPSAKGA